MNSTAVCEDGKVRCQWCTATPEYIAYHDKEWGYPVDDDIRLFEKITLESFQSGLSWRTILAKRENFRAVFAGFDYNKVAAFGENDIMRLLADSGIVRHRKKIEAAINNAQQAKLIVKEYGSLAAYFWRFEPNQTTLATPQSISVSDVSKALSKDLKKKGWKFVGPTTVYAFMQAMGLINDHAEYCAYRDEVQKAREKFNKPKTIAI
ncbi:DNA-3-methyladenine glycosylase I [Catenovulum sediminis]|uniref:DNA-3-methyladenine glycosylase I n=1 Tax=Catenovulum sediminis TaxID=1740262 RepID=A0ABV1RJA9_9ALTE